MSDREGNNSNDSTNLSTSSDENHPIALLGVDGDSYIAIEHDFDINQYFEDSAMLAAPYLQNGPLIWRWSGNPLIGAICLREQINNDTSDHVDQSDAEMSERDSGDDQSDAEMPERDSGDDQSDVDMPGGDSDDDQSDADTLGRDSDDDQSDADMPRGDPDDEQSDADMPRGDPDDEQSDADMPRGDPDDEQSDADMPRGDPDDDQRDAEMPRGDPDDDQSDVDMMCNLLRIVASEITLEEFIMKKMQDRPPRYEDIGKDRVVPFDVDPDEPPPLYQCIYYAYPAKFSHDDSYPYLYPSSTIDYNVEMNSDQPITITELLTMTTAEVATGRTNDEIIPSPEPINENCELQELQNTSQ